MTNISTHETPHHCVVVGGGFAGITAAVRLAEVGIRVTVVEARAEAGGRVQSLNDHTTGETIDNGQHLLMGCYDATLRLLQTLGTTHLLRRQAALRVWFGDCLEQINNGNGAKIFALDASRLPSKLGMAYGMLNLHGLSLHEKYDLLRFAARLQLNLVKPMNKTAWELLREERQSERVITRLWEPIILATLNAPVHAASATLLVQVMRLAFLGGREASQILIAETGLQEVLSSARSFLEQRGSRIVTATVKRLLYENGVVCGVECVNGEKFFADSIISALPSAMMLKLLPDDVRNTSYFHALQGFETSPIISIYLWMDGDFLEQDFIALLGTATQWVFNRRKLCVAPNDVTERFPGHCSLTISAASELAQRGQTEIVESCWSELQRAFPRARTAQLLHSRVIRERHATPLFTPENEHLRPNAETPLQNLFLAGDWTNTGLPATIESAARSGERAADAVLTQLSAQNQSALRSHP